MKLKIIIFIFQDDTHLNELGNKIFADYLLKILLK